ncbi:MAG: VCBS repeat-containing protein [Pirellulaceae bacterium]|nr:VCBS repeat-containing protein [Pirellulaceae bacterium]
MRFSIAWWIVIPICVVAGPGWMHGQQVRLAPVTAPAGEPAAPAAPTVAAPKWDARGPGLSPWQAIACVDMADDGSRIALGTLALPGDPNVFLLDGNGKLLAQFTAGMRGPEQVALADQGRAVVALYGTPKGRSGDKPQAWCFFADGSTPKPIENLIDRQGETIFHYGDHSNHLGVFLFNCGDRVVIAGGGEVFSLAVVGEATPKPARLGGSLGHLTTTAAASRSGLVVVGCAKSDVSEPTDAKRGGGNLFLLQPGESGPLWSRPVVTDVDSAPPPEEGIYGPPAPEYRDAKLYAPLAVAIDADGRRIAVADYQGWQRHFAAKGIRRAEDYGVRFMPARPTITVYDREGKPLRRFGPETFQEPFWCELAFQQSGKLEVRPRTWPCRGLAGRGVLPTDEQAHRRYVLDVVTGQVQTAEAGPPVLVRQARDGKTLVCDGTLVRMLDPVGSQLWKCDIKQVAATDATIRPSPAKNLKATEIAAGIWTSGGGSTHSDMGGQYVIEAPDGLLLIDPNAGLSFAQNWARIKGAGLDPRRVRYVLLTHEHGDHAPGAYLWRVITGAQVVAGAEAAYSLQHHIPYGSGYGFHPPQPVDIAVSEDCELDLAGLKVRAIRTPGHTYGSMGWMFEKDGKRWVAIGDLIMPRGTLGYFGSINFSAADVLASLRKLAALIPDGILPGHGPSGDPEPYLKGVEVGEATGWGKMKPEKPDPMYGFQSRDYLVVGWLEPIQSAAFGDVDGDSRPDVALLVTAPRGMALKIYLNKGGRFAEQPDSVIELPQLETGFKLRICRLNGDRTADFLATSESTALLLLSQDEKFAYQAQTFSIPRAATIASGDFSGDGRTDCVVGSRFVSGFQTLLQSEDGRFRAGRQYKTERMYFDLELVDVNEDGGPDLLLSNGDVFLRRADGGLPEEPSFTLSPPGAGWPYLAVGDFNGDKRPDVLLLAQPPEGETSARLAVYCSTGDLQRPFADKPSTEFDLPLERGLLRDGPTVGDFNGDGVADVVIAAGQGTQAIVLIGGDNGLDLKRKVVVPLDFSLHHDTKLGLADFTGTGQATVAVFGTSAVGAPGVYIRQHD